MAKVVYQGSPDAEHGSEEDILFEQGVRMGSFGMLLHSLVGMIDCRYVIISNLVATNNIIQVKYCEIVYEIFYL